MENPRQKTLEDDASTPLQKKKLLNGSYALFGNQTSSIKKNYFTQQPTQTHLLVDAKSPIPPG